MMAALLMHPVFAQIPAAVEQPVAKPIIIMIVLLALSLAPFFVMLSTSFVKISVVFSLVRTALGTQQIPPNQVITGLALILTIYIMIPVGVDIYTDIQDVITENSQSNQPLLSVASFDVVKNAVDKGKEPLREFLVRHGNAKDRNLFYSLAKKLRGNREHAEIKETDFMVVLPAFIISELSEAFQIGFILFLPFLVIDMVVSNILLSMGMFMVSPITVALPFKLLLFVLVDGWYLLTKGLILGYM